jgi:hypothetical protein
MPRKPRVPPHRGLSSFLPYLGNVRKPASRRERLVEFIDGELMFNPTRGFDDFVLVTRNILLRFEEDVSSKLGQHVLAQIVKHANEEYYGDFYQGRPCSNCDEEFYPHYSVIFANALLQGTVCCPNCGTACSG